MRAIGYVRVSTEGQAVDGVSLDAQRAKIAAWADLNGYDHVELFTDAGISGCRADNRPGLQAALETVSKGDALVVYSLSRLARSTKDTIAIAERLNREGADLVSLSEKIDTTTAAGKMVFRMMAVLNEFERDQVSERTKAALAHKKSKGERTGSVPYGYQLAADAVNLETSPHEQEVIAAVKQYKAAGLSLRVIADRLESRGMMNREGKKFNPKSVARLAA